MSASPERPRGEGAREPTLLGRILRASRNLTGYALSGDPRAAAGALAILALWAVVLSLRGHGHQGPGLWLTVRAGLGSAGPLLHSEAVPGIDADAIAARIDLPQRFTTLRWTGLWLVRRACVCDVQIRGAAEASLFVDGARVLHREREQPEARVRGEVRLDPGFHALDVEYRQGTEAPFLRVSWAPGGEDLRPLGPADLFRAGSAPGDVAVETFLAPLGRLLGAAGVSLAALLLLGFLRRGRGTSVLAWALPGLVAAYALALRFEFLTARTWGAEAPALAVQVQHAISHLHPRWVLERAPVPYEGDPFSYIRLGKEMVHFYDASPREPLFVFATRCFQGLLGGQDVAVAFASTAFSVLLVIATYLLGAAAFSRGVGLVAALALAVEHEVVELAAEGWRDDAFAFFVVLSALAWVRLVKKPSFGAAVFAGLAGGGACLTRITSLSFVVPLWIYAMGALPVHPLRRRLGIVGLSAGVSFACLAPYLATCAWVFHDPLYSINYHALYYSDAERSSREPMSAARYVLGHPPFHLADTLLLGVTSVPFEQRWSGFDYWLPGLGRALALLSLAGLAAFVFSPQGRLVLLVLVTSLVPFAFTWNVPGGSAWRFRLQAYPFYLLAAGAALVGGGRLLDAALRRRPLGVSPRQVLAKGALAGLAAAAAWGGVLGLATLRVREEIAAGSGTIEVGRARNRLFVGSGWSPCARLGDIPVRLSGQRSTLHLPLKAGAGYALRLRMDPYPHDGAPAQVVGVLLNGSAVGSVVLVPGARFGSYALHLPAATVHDGWNELAFDAARTSRVDAAPFGRWGQWNVAFAVWLVGLTRDPPGGERPP